ncbi:hypothetical protein HME7025_00106 [Aquirufa nivalisilvae]|uniref:Uncharacterized protein n=1 Tax=Aquirufa nivalisilvae TaxID=2516557 RepID=A0A2S2DRG7_9BACT|nr:hypothetical protein [Aquirufa nivalisilvae]AWL07991.1 hypothetical protein HME7025_00106 [Aquirufa nivalisilvae]
MFGIRINNEWVDLSPSMSDGQSPIKLSRYNSLFDFEGISGSQVNDFSVPFTPKNDEIFGWFRLPQIKYNYQEYYCEKVADGYIIERGYVTIVNCTESEYVLTFSQNLSEIFGVYHNMPMNQFPLGIVPIAPIKDANHLTDAICWPTVDNNLFYGTNTLAGFTGKMNSWSGLTLNDIARVPMVFLRHFFEQLANRCSFKFKGTFFTSDIFKRMVFVNTQSIDFKYEIFLEDHLPADLTISEFIKELRKLLNLAIYFDITNRIMYAYWGNELLDKPVRRNWTKKVTPSTARTPELANRLELDWELDSNDNLFKPNIYYPLPTGFSKYQSNATGEIFQIKSKISTIVEVSGTAIMEQIGISSRFNQTGSKFSPRIAFWKGLVYDDPTISNAMDGLTLGFVGSNPIITKCYWNYEKLRRNTCYKTVIADLNAIDLYAIDWHNNPDADHAVFIDGKEYYITQVEVLLPLQGVSKLYLMEKP